MTLAEALQLIAAPSTTASSRRDAWKTVNEALHQRWFEAHSSRFGARPDLVEDVRQTVLEKLLSGRATFVGSTDGQAVNFLKATARNATVDTLRRRKYEASLTNEQVDEIAGGQLADDGLRANAISRRLMEVVERATKIARSPARPALERHLRETIFGQGPSDASLDADATASARLRKERSRALGLLRRAHEELVGEVVQDVNDEVDHVVRTILIPIRATTEES